MRRRIERRIGRVEIMKRERKEEERGRHGERGGEATGDGGVLEVKRAVWELQYMQALEPSCSLH